MLNYLVMKLYMHVCVCVHVCVNTNVFIFFKRLMIFEFFLFREPELTFSSLKNPSKRATVLDKAFGTDFVESRILKG